MELTKQQAIEGHRKMWNWIADKIEQEKEILEIGRERRRYCANEHKHLRYDNFCCEFNNDTPFCKDCPLEWGRNSECSNSKKTGLFDMVENASSWEKQAELARIIAKLPKRNSSDKNIMSAIEYFKTQMRYDRQHKTFYDLYGLPIYDETIYDLIRWYELAIEALEKQLPKIPNEVKDAYTPKIGEFRVGKCPNCKKEVSDRFNVCLDCGQSLDWSGEDGI